MSKTIIIALPKGAYVALVQNYGDGSELIYMIELDARDETLQSIPLPPGSWSILATTEQVLADEELAEQCVERSITAIGLFSKTNMKMYPHYCERNIPSTYSSPIPSFQSLLQSLAIEQGVVLIQTNEARCRS